jgi:UDP-N-acetylmuramoyl-L-alanyl-D-glutamate--2,6-diaminopimelate ligase
MSISNILANGGKKLTDLLKPSDFYTIYMKSNPTVTGIKYDSRKVVQGDLFCAIKGFATDGNAYVKDARSQGAVAIVSGKEPDKKQAEYWIKVRDIRLALSRISGVFYDYPWKDSLMIGITGTNGKTTITYLLKSIFDNAGHNAGVLGTIGYLVGDEKIRASRTTPEAPEINTMIRSMQKKGVKCCIMEVSSHSLELKRVADLQFDSAIYTNLTTDHLDYHLTMENYYQAKKKLFSLIKKEGFAVINVDDTYGARMAREVQVSGEKVITVGKNDAADVRIIDYKMNDKGSRITLTAGSEDVRVDTNLFGLPNVYNVTTSFAVAWGMGLKIPTILQGIAGLEAVEGRMERVDAGQDFKIIVDYAHSPDALMNLLVTVRQITNGRVITVFGCGGNRDKSKRPMMGQHAALLSDIAIVTSDNPRNEPPGQIIRDILVGINEVKKTVRYRVIENRREAIKAAIMTAQKGDAVVIAGKGHEDYQIIGGKELPFDDRKTSWEFAKAKIEGRL